MYNLKATMPFIFLLAILAVNTSFAQTESAVGPSETLGCNPRPPQLPPPTPKVAPVDPVIVQMLVSILTVAGCL